MSLSAVTIKTSWPSSEARRARVPSTSSASKPGISNIGIPMARTIFFTCGICEMSSSGVSGLWAL